MVQKEKTFPEIKKEGLIGNLVCGTSRVAEDNDSRPGRAEWVDMFRDVPGPELVRWRGCWRLSGSEVEPREGRAQGLHFEAVFPNGHMAPQLAKTQ